jgi:hypothetical protein
MAPTQPLLIFVGLIIAATIQLALISTSGIPLGIPGEWQWSRHELATPLKLAVAQFVPGVLGAVALLIATTIGHRRLLLHHLRNSNDKPAQRQGPHFLFTGVLLLSLVAGSWVWLKAVERCTPSLHRNLKSMWVLYDPSSSGYFHEAAFKIDSTSEFLSSYESRMEEGEIYHVGTHPPGLFLLSEWAIQLCENIPAVSKQLGTWMPSDVRDAFRSMEAKVSLGERLSDEQLTALFLLSELTTLAAAFTIIPLFYTFRRCFNALVAWRATCLWATLPCLVVFLPKSDVLFTLTSMSAVSFGIIAMSSSQNMFLRLLPAIASGLVLWAGLMLSLAHLPVLALLGILFLVRFMRDSRRKPGVPRHPVMAMLQGLVVFSVIPATILAATAAFSSETQCDMFAVWKMNISNHVGFYDHHTRTAWKWMIVNVLELGMMIGLPIAFAGVVGLVGLGVANLRVLRSAVGVSETLSVDFALSVVFTVGFLWLSGRNSGEAARLWCFLTPWLLVFPAHLLRAENRSHGARRPPRLWHSLMFIQLVVCVLTAGRVSGFSF